MTEARPRQQGSQSATSASDILKTIFENIEGAAALTKEDVEKVWEKAAGSASIQHTKIGALRSGRLTVFVDSAVWMQKLTMEKRTILKELRRVFGKDKISEIQLKIGDF